MGGTCERIELGNEGRCVDRPLSFGGGVGGRSSTGKPVLI